MFFSLELGFCVGAMPGWKEGESVLVRECLLGHLQRKR